MRIWTFLQLTALVAAVAVGVLASSGTASAEAEAPWWHLNVGARPTRLVPGHEGTVVISATNLGDGSVDGESSPVVVTDKLPPGVEAVKAFYLAGPSGIAGEGACQVPSGSEVVCTLGRTLTSIRHHGERRVVFG